MEPAVSVRQHEHRVVPEPAPNVNERKVVNVPNPSRLSHWQHDLPIQQSLETTTGGGQLIT